MPMFGISLEILLIILSVILSYRDLFTDFFRDFDFFQNLLEIYSDIPPGIPSMILSNFFLEFPSKFLGGFFFSKFFLDFLSGFLQEFHPGLIELEIPSFKNSSKIFAWTSWDEIWDSYRYSTSVLSGIAPKISSKIPSRISFWDIAFDITPRISLRIFPETGFFPMVFSKWKKRVLRLCNASHALSNESNFIYGFTHTKRL